MVLQDWEVYRRRNRTQVQRELTWLQDPVVWAHDRLDAYLWAKQRQIVESVRDYPDTAVHSCHNVGKSFSAAVACCWWIDAHPPGTAFVVTTAPTGAQVKAILWREIGRLHRRGRLPGRTNLTEWYLDWEGGAELVAFGRKPDEYDSDAFQGIHALHVLVVIDEACGVEESLWDAASTLTSNRYGRTLAIGNPDDPRSKFARVCTPSSGWNVIGVGYRDTPNFTSEEVPQELHDLLISEAWVRKKAREWGEDSALYVSKCLGLFPSVEVDPWVVVPYQWVAPCRYLELPEGEPVEAGIDVGAGSDRTVMRERRGSRVGREAVFVDDDPMRTVGRLVEKVNEWGVRRVKIDVIGIGWGIYGRLRELSSLHNPSGERTHDAEVVEVNFAKQSSDPKKFLNLRAQVWWDVGRELTRLRAWDLSQVDDDVAGELTTPRYEILDSRGKIKIEEKKRIRERLGLSPDRAEALLLAFWTGGVSQVDTSGAEKMFGVDLLEGTMGQSRQDAWRA